MKFLVDVNASGAVARWLLEMGHDVEQVAAKDPRMRDEDILSWAVREGRIIVTTDQDFEAMIWRQGKNPLWCFTAGELAARGKKGIAGGCAGSP
jgi:predicted nuclease of predicted toxin-antitoxin system